MKIKCDLANDFFEVYDEAKAVAVHKKEILKTKEVPTKTFMQDIVSLFILIFLIGLIPRFISDKLILLSLLIFIYATLFLLYYIGNVFLVYFFRKKTDFKTVVTIDEEGLTTDSYYEIKMTFSWKQLLAVVETRYAIVILTDTPCYFYFSKQNKKQLLAAIKKYQPKMLIIK